MRSSLYHHNHQLTLTYVCFAGLRMLRTPIKRTAIHTSHFFALTTSWLCKINSFFCDKVMRFLLIVRRCGTLSEEYRGDYHDIALTPPAALAYDLPNANAFQNVVVVVDEICALGGIYRWSCSAQLQLHPYLLRQHACRRSTAAKPTQPYTNGDTVYNQTRTTKPVARTNVCSTYTTHSHICSTHG